MGQRQHWPWLCRIPNVPSTTNPITPPSHGFRNRPHMSSSNVGEQLGDYPDASEHNIALCISMRPTIKQFRCSSLYNACQHHSLSPQNTSLSPIHVEEAQCSLYRSYLHNCRILTNADVGVFKHYLKYIL